MLYEVVLWAFKKKTYFIMKKYIVFVVIACVCCLSTHAQYSCKDCVYNLYKVLQTSQLEYIDIGDNTYSAKLLYQDQNDSVVLSAIAKARVFSYGNPLDSVVELDLGTKALYFMVTTEPPRCFGYSDINSIYDGRGHNLLYKEDYMKFPAVINDTDGFTYVREKPSIKSKVKMKIRKNLIFLYTPIWGSSWYKAYSDDGSLFLGYIYRKRIVPFDKCPADIKKKMKKLMFD